MSISLPIPKTPQLLEDGSICSCECHLNQWPSAHFGAQCCYYPSRAAELHDRKILDRDHLSGKELGSFLDEFQSTLPWYVRPMRFILEWSVRRTILDLFKSKGLVP